MDIIDNMVAQMVLAVICEWVELIYLFFPNMNELNISIAIMQNILWFYDHHSCGRILPLNLLVAD
jgi:hypothetical protein